MDYADLLLSCTSAVPLCTTAVLGICTALFLKKFHLPYIWRHGVDRASNRNGGELVAQVLKSHNIKTMFTLVGGHISPILVESEKLGIKIIDVRHEASTVFAADAVARLTGTVGVAAVTAGPGITNTVTAVKNAQMAESPILLMGGGSPSLLKGRGALQDIDQISLMKPICKKVYTIHTLREIIPKLREALHTAQSNIPGPVFVEFPIDTLYPMKMIEKEITNTGSGKSLFQKIAGWYLNNYASNLFAGAWEKRDVTPIPPQIPRPNSTIVSKAVEMIKESKKPLFVLGSQVILPPVTADETQSALEALGIPCYLGGMSRGLLGKKNPLHMRQCRKDALKEADVVILAGSVPDFRLGYGKSFSRKSKIISINRSSRNATKNSDMFWKPALVGECDVGLFIQELAKNLSGLKVDSDWIDTLRARDDNKEKKNEEMGEVAGSYLNPLNVLSVLEECLPDNALLVADGGDFVGSAAYILRPRGPLTWLDPGAFGTLGVGGGFAMGAKACRPDSEVYIIWGDGACGFSLPEFDTFVRFKLPVIAVVGNDACWSQIAREQIPMFNKDTACQLAMTDYHVAAEGLGAKGILLQAGNREEIANAFKQAQKLYHEGHSVLINVLISKSKFREGSISV